MSSEVTWSPRGIAWGFCILSPFLFMVVCGCSPRVEDMSPRQIVKLANKAAESKNRELLKKLAYVPNGQAREQVQATVDSLIEKSEESSTAHAMFKFLFRYKLGTERIYADKAYVYMYTLRRQPLVGHRNSLMQHMLAF